MKLELEKRLLEKEITLWLEKGYKVDIKNGVVRGIEYHSRVAEINVADTDFTESDFENIIHRAELEIAFANSYKPITTSF